VKFRVLTAIALAVSFLGIATQTAVATGVSQTPLLISPAAGVTYDVGSGLLSLDYVIAQPQPGSIQFTMVSTSDSSTFRAIALDSTWPHAVLNMFNPLDTRDNLLLTGHVLGVSTTIAGVSANTSSLPSGTYNVTLSYQDSLGHTASQANANGVTFNVACPSGYTSNSGYTPCTPTPTTTSTTTTTTTVAPTSTSTTTTTIPAATVAAVATCSVKHGKSISRACIAKNAGITIASTSKVVIKVTSGSAKVCTVKGSAITTKKVGTCSATLTVTPKGGKAKKYSAKVSVT